MIFRRTERSSPPPYLAPFALAHNDVRELPFTPTTIVGDTVQGVVTMPDGSHAQGEAPLHTLRRVT